MAFSNILLMRKNKLEIIPDLIQQLEKDKTCPIETKHATVVVMSFISFSDDLCYLEVFTRSFIHDVILLSGG